MKPSRNEGSRLRVLLIAEQCNPEQTSVPLVSWYYYRELRKLADIHLVTQVRNAESLRNAGLKEGEDFTAIDSERVARPLWRVSGLLRGGKGKGWTTVMALNVPAYYYFEHLLWKRFSPAIRTGEFDVVHRLTPLSTAVPSPIAKACAALGVPFVLGPMNGGLPWPAEFRSEQAREREWLSTVRGLSRRIPYWKSTYACAASVISGSRNTWDQLEPVAHGRHVYLPRNGVDVSEFDFSVRPGAVDPQRPLRLLFIGRLVPLKGVDMLLEAAAPLLKTGSVELSIVGDGPERARLEEIAAQEKLPGVVFHGNVPHHMVRSWIASSDVFVFPSIREFGGAVVLEAMSSGLPVIVMNYGGPGELASKECGVLIPMAPKATIVANLRDAIMCMDEDRERLAVKGKAARTRAEQSFDWRVKARQLLEVYQSVAGHEKAAPCA